MQELMALNPILLLGGVHGDEPLGVRLAEDTLEWLKMQPDSTVVPWILIPCINPDGFNAHSRVNGRGIDLNRNYPASNWQAEAKQARYFPGPHPGSEPEVQGVVKLILDHRPRLLIHCHSWEPCVVCTGEPGLKDAQRLADSSGYELKASIGYETPGSLSWFGWHDHEIPVICIEESDHTEPAATWDNFGEGIKAIFCDLSSRRDK